jgi:hypothetical protein
MYLTVYHDIIPLDGIEVFMQGEINSLAIGSHSLRPGGFFGHALDRKERFADDFLQ